MFDSIVVPVDTREPTTWSAILPAALSMARMYESRLTLCTVVPDLHAMMEAEWSAIGYRQMVDTAREQLASLVASYPDLAAAKIEVGSGSVWRGIIDIATRAEADLIVLSSHRPAMKDYLLGANAVSVVRHASCSVMVVRAKIGED